MLFDYSNLYKSLLKIAGITLFVLFLCSCTHTIAFHESHHYDLPISKKSANIITVIDKSTLESVVSVRSVITGLMHRWDAQPGKMLKHVADIEFPQMYNEYVFSNSIIEPPWEDNTFMLLLSIPEYQFKNLHAYFTVRTVVYDESSVLMEKIYKEEGESQGSKMFWAGAFGMKSAMRQTSLDALKKVFKQIRVDLANLLEFRPLKSDDEDVNEYYSPRESVDSFDEGEYEYYSPQDSEDSFDFDADKDKLKIDEYQEGKSIYSFNSVTDNT